MFLFSNWFAMPLEFKAKQKKKKMKWNEICKTMDLYHIGELLILFFHFLTLNNKSKQREPLSVKLSIISIHRLNSIFFFCYCCSVTTYSDSSMVWLIWYNIIDIIHSEEMDNSESVHCINASDILSTPRSFSLPLCLRTFSQRK